MLIKRFSGADTGKPVSSVAAAICLSVASIPIKADVIFSEYIEGSSNNKAIEITNVSGGTIDLSRVDVWLATNGKPIDDGGVTKITLSGSLDAGGSYVIANGSAVAAIKDKADLTSGVANFNGDDGVILRLDGAVVDVIGQVGTDPGSAWTGAGGASTKDKTLRRIGNTGDAVHDDAFDPSVGWSVLPKDTFDGLGCSGVDACSAGGGNAAPTLTGTPSGTATIDTAYSFTPVSDDADSDPLTFSIQNKPSWATFNDQNGALTGTPQAGDEGDYANIIISVTDGNNDAVSLAAFTITVAAANNNPSSNLVITEYIEGSSNNKAIEITNFGADAVDLSRVKVVLADNGKPLSTDGLKNITLTGSLAAGASYVIGNSGAVDDVKNKSDVFGTVTYFNGDDGIALYLDDQVVDSFGQIGTDPGSSWTGANGASTANKTLRRNDGITTGDTVYDDAFNLDAEWTTFDQDTFDGLGCSGTAACQPSGPNQAPTIDGTPATTATVGAAYSFTPSSNDAEGDALTFAITNKPSWATFSDQTGALTGTPQAGDVGDFADITITVTDGNSAAVALAAFTITVAADDGGDPPAATPKLVITEYIEGSSNNKAIELTNFDDQTLDLTRVKVVLADNGKPLSTDGLKSITLTGSLAAGASYVIGNSGAVDDVKNKSDVFATVTYFNGDDTIAVYVDDQIVDVMGQAGFDPGSAWTGDGGLSTKDKTIRRNADVQQGDVIADDVFDLNAQWTVFPQNTFDGLGCSGVAACSDNGGGNGGNTPPTINGSPATSITAGSAYSFTPSSNDVDSDSLTFSITNKPSWASFNDQNGALTGTPQAGDVGSFANIVISVNDGTNPAVSLPAFTITVNAVGGGDGGGNNGGGNNGGGDGGFDYNTYYADALGKTGAELEAALSLIARQGHQRMSYSDVWDALKYTDEDPNNTSNVLLFYSGRSQAKNTNGGGTNDWNREHSWPKSHGFPSTSQYGYTDIHHLRPTDVTVNSSRGSKDYDDGGSPVNRSPNTYTDSDSFEPRDQVKGDSARMMFYMAVRYDGTDGGMPDLELVNNNSASSSPTLGVLCTLMDWHRADPVDAFETRRHTRTVERQGNRNPFIDNPNFAETLYGGTCPPPGNVAPVISGSPQTLIGWDAAYNFTPAATDSNSDSLTFSIQNKPSWADFDQSNGVLSGTPAQGDAGTYSNIIITVSDGELSASLTAFAIEVVDPASINFPPEISGTPTTTAKAGEAWTFTPDATDPETDNLTFAVTNKADWMSFDTTTGTLSGTPAESDVGTVSDIVISVNDGRNPAVSLDSFDLRVRSANVVTGLIFTEYVEGSSNNKAVEITNFTDNAIDLSRVKVVLANNGKTLDTVGLNTANPTGTLASGESYVIGNSGADDGLKSRSDMFSTITYFNGDDALVLYVDDEIVDVFGQVGTDPGSNWGSGDTATNEHTLRRKVGFETGDNTHDDAFDPATEWQGFAQNTFDGLGCSGVAACSGNGGGNGGNTPPTISGSPTTSITAGNAYSFTPSSNDVDGDSLTFSIHNKPSWASFNDQNGALTGTPQDSDVGSFVNIVISVNDGTNTAVSLAGFTITVNAVGGGDNGGGNNGGGDGGFDYNAYYANAIGKTGAELEAALSLIARQGHQRMSYSDVWDALKYTDEDPNNTSNVLLFYSGRSQAKNTNGGGSNDWNREHSWPKSHGFPSSSQYGYTDIHHLRPTDVTVNSSRGSKDYDDGGSPVNRSPNTYTDSDSFEPRDQVKGDSARMMFYMAVRYDGTDGGMPDLELVNNNSASSSPTLGVLCTLMDWHRADPVDAFETRRHTRTVERQGNRNPFIDNPNFAETLYGGTCPPPGNVAPVITGSPQTLIGWDANYSFAPAATDSNNDSLTFSIQNKPSWADFDQSNGILSGTPAQGDAGTYSNIVITVSDGELSASLTAFAINVVDPASINFPPQISGTPTTSVKAGENWSFTPVSTDPESDSLTFAVTNKADWMSFDTTTGTLSGTPTESDVGTVSGIVISVNDGRNPAVALDAFDLRVRSATVVTGVIFTEYVEGSGSNKAVEITNFTDSAIDLSRVKIVLANNGKTLDTAGLNTATPTGTLAAGASYVIGNSGADDGLKSKSDMFSTITYFNGDDALVLYVDDEIVDVFGQVGTDPGSNWGSGETATKEQTLRRNASIESGDTVHDDAFDPAAEWQGFSQNTFDGLGCSGTAACGSTGGDGGTPELGICGDGSTTLISAIQGSGNSTQMTGANVVVEGVVVSSLQGEGGYSGFFIQEETTDSDNDPQTSEGIFVYHTADAVNVGDQVRLLAQAKEYKGLTELASVQGLTVCANNQLSLITPASVNMPFDSDTSLEAVEGMAVVFPQSLTVTLDYNFAKEGQIELSNGRLLQPTEKYAANSQQRSDLAAANALNRIILDDGLTADNPDTISFYPTFSATDALRSGATVQNLAAVVTVSNNDFHLIATSQPQFVDANPRKAVPTPRQSDADIRVASFNVLNYFTRYNGRGADNAQEFQRQRDKIITAIVASDADILGLMEIENNGYAADSAIADLVEGLNAKDDLHNWAFVDPGVAKIGTDEIAVGLIYRSDRVGLKGDAVIITDEPFDANTRKHRPPLVQTFNSLQGGEDLTIIVNHFKSKGSACGGGHDDSVQGNCNGQRVLAAQALVNILANGNPTGQATDNVMVLGDLNAYSQEDPLQTFYTAGFSNVGNEKEVGEHYSYFFGGQAGSLDHMLLPTAVLDKVVQAEHWHINADETRYLDYNTEGKSAAQLANWYANNPFRSSDHDPVVADINLVGDNAGSNRRPTISGSPATHIIVGNTYTFTPASNDADNDPVTFSIANQPSWASFDTNTGELTGTPVDGDINTYADIRITVTDGQLSSTLQAFSIAVYPAGNTAPVISGQPTEVIEAGEDYSFTPDVNDADGDTLTFAIENKPDWASFDTTTGALTGSPANADAGQYQNIVISVTDGKSPPVALNAFTLTVREAASGTSFPVIFTEYVEGSSNNKAVEITNFGSSAFDLSRVKIVLANNGKTLDTSGLNNITLSGTLGAGESYVITNASSNDQLAPKSDVTSNITYFNGDDALVLLVDDQINDVIGRVGERQTWGSGDTSMKDHTLRRKNGITTGDRIADDSFVPSEQWVGFSRDTFDGLGCSGESACSGDGGVFVPADFGQCGDGTETLISAVQGAGDASPMAGNAAVIEAIVTADLQQANQAKGFWVQEETAQQDDNAATSEGLFIGWTDSDVSVGDKVRISGQVAESFGQTTINNIDRVEVCASSQLNLTAAVEVTLPVADENVKESLEGMWINLPQNLFVTVGSGFTRYGEIQVSSGRLKQPRNAESMTDDEYERRYQKLRNRRLYVDDGSNSTYPESISYYPTINADDPLRSGSKVSGISGVMSYTFGNYKVVPVNQPQFVNATPRRSKPFTRLYGDHIRVASMNVLNYYTRFDGRGADNDNEFGRQKRKIVKALTLLNADIIGLMEIENGFGAGSAIEDLVAALNEKDNINTWNFVNPGIAEVGTDEVMVAIIYRENRVSPVGNPMVITDVPFDAATASHRAPILQTFEPLVGGDKLVVAVNHFRSKGGSCGAGDDSTTQGACNGQRVKAAQTVVGLFNNGDPTGQDAKHAAILGDFNAYTWEDPMQVFYGQQFANLARDKAQGDNYSYYYDGVAGSLDHMLYKSLETPNVASVALNKSRLRSSVFTQADGSAANDIVAQVMHWHINSDEMPALDYNTENKSENQQNDWYRPDQYRSSDHDPVLTDFDLTGTGIINLPPVINGTPATFVETQSAYSFTATANDPENEALQFSIENKPAWATFANGVLSGTPSDADKGVYNNILISVTDGVHTVSLPSFTITVDEKNLAPVPGNDSYSVPERSSLSVDVLLNDIDPNGDSLTLSDVTLISGKGEVSVTANQTVNYRTVEGFLGDAVAHYTVMDSKGASATGVITFTVENVNDAPVANNDTATTQEDTAVLIDVLANDSDIDGDVLTIDSVELISGDGDVTIENNQLLFTPTANTSGDAVINYTVRDAGGLTATATVSVTISAVNDAPVATNDVVTMAEDTSLMIDVLANDTDEEQQTLTLVSATIESGEGTAIVDDQQVRLTPANNVFGQLVASYVVADADGAQATGTITATVSNVNDAPVASDDAATVAENSAVTVDVLANDTDVDNDSLTVTAATVTAGQGSAVVVDGQRVMFTPAANQFGPMAVSYQITDGEAVATATIALTVTSVNYAPVANTDSYQMNENQTANFTPLTNDTDADGDQLTITAATVTAGNATVSVIGGTSLQFTPATDATGAMTVSYVVTDGNLTATGLINVVVNNVNAAPVANADTFSVNENTTTLLNVLANDSDVDGDSLTLSSATVTAGNATVRVVNNQIEFTPAIDATGTFGVSYVISDGELTATSQATVTVNNVNTAPVANADTFSVNENTTTLLNVLANDSDVDGDSLTLSSATVTAGNATVRVVNNQIEFTPAIDATGTFGVSYVISDGELTATSQATITVNAVNAAPVANADSVTLDEDSSVQVSPLSNDTDADGDTLTITSVAMTTGNAAISVANNVVTITPAADQNGAMTASYQVTDGTETASGLINITVNAVNDAPVAANDTATVSTRAAATIDVLSNDNDVDGDTLTIESASADVGTVSVTADNTLRYEAPADGTTAATITYVVTDGSLTAQATVAVTITADNVAPVANDDTVNLAVGEFTALIDVLANDTDADNDTLTITGASTTIGSAVIQNNQIFLTVNNDFSGQGTVDYDISDGFGGTASGVINVEKAIDTTINLTVPADQTVNATALFTQVNPGVATATNGQGDSLAVELLSETFLMPGRHALIWRACISADICQTATQTINVTPIISIMTSQTVVEGNQVQVPVQLNGEHFNYPVAIPFTVAGTTDAADHDLVAGTVTIANGTTGTLTFTTTADAVADNNETVIITLTQNADNALNLAGNTTHTVTVVEDNLAPVAVLSATQADEARTTVVASDGEITIAAAVTDANAEDTHTVSWSAPSLTATNQTDAAFSFDPSNLTAGVYTIEFTATDNEGLSDVTTINLNLIVNAPALDENADSDGDGTPDSEEGLADTDGDGIPDYLDRFDDQCNQLPASTENWNAYLLETEGGVCMGLGSLAMGSEGHGAQLSADDMANNPNLPADDQVEFASGVYDFVATLPGDATSLQLLIPQAAPIPAGAMYRKFIAGQGWTTFEDVDGNAIHSAAGQAGFCPAIGDESAWQSGLNEGHWCIRITLVDGGIYDADGMQNGVIVDPGGIATEVNNNTAPVATNDTATVEKNQSVTINVLANDSDVDGDNLTVVSATAQTGAVTINNDQSVTYQPQTDFVGNDTIDYSVSDANGGIASAQVAVTVTEVTVPVNQAPVAANDTAETLNNQAVTVDVLANDSDPEGDALTITAADADWGTVTINSDNTLTWTPADTQTGVATVTYTIADPQGAEATATLAITVTAPPVTPPPPPKKSGGGSVPFGLLAGFALMAMLRRSRLQVRR